MMLTLLSWFLMLSGAALWAVFVLLLVLAYTDDEPDDFCPECGEPQYEPRWRG